MNETMNQNILDIVYKIEDACLNHNNNDILMAVSVYLIDIITMGCEQLGRPDGIRVVGTRFNEMLNHGLEKAIIRCEQKVNKQ